MSERLSPNHPEYEARLRAQHGLVAALANVPIGFVGGLLMGLVPATYVEGLPAALLPAGVTSVLLALGIGLIVLAVFQGFPGLAAGFWNLRHSMEELSADKRLAWYTFLAGLFFTGTGLGFALAFVLK